jgi:hypothetical protein
MRLLDGNGVSNRVGVEASKPSKVEGSLHRVSPGEHQAKPSATMMPVIVVEGPATAALADVQLAHVRRGAVNALNFTSAFGGIADMAGLAGGPTQSRMTQAV